MDRFRKTFDKIARRVLEIVAAYEMTVVTKRGSGLVVVQDSMGYERLSDTASAKRSARCGIVRKIWIANHLPETSVRLCCCGDQLGHWGTGGQRLWSRSCCEHLLCNCGTVVLSAKKFGKLPMCENSDLEFNVSFSLQFLPTTWHTTKSL